MAVLGRASPRARGSGAVVHLSFDVIQLIWLGDQIETMKLSKGRAHEGFGLTSPSEKEGHRHSSSIGLNSESLRGRTWLHYQSQIASSSIREILPNVDSLCHCRRRSIHRTPTLATISSFQSPARPR
ncbi:hypothetical protein NL676_032586 [Syzygium grande]|nr:hypothetical protein NL676_032586 [Syzygium grande]